MSAPFHIECAITALEHACDEAVKASIDEHFISEIKHLISTAKANRKESKQ